MGARLGIGLWWILCLLGALPAVAAPPLCTTHFFDWYVIGDAAGLDKRQKEWTYRVDWQALGIRPDEIGTSVHYYEAQFHKIREAGFDGLHYEWHGNDPKPQFVEAMRKTGLPAAMFYDMEIRFSPRPSFITPTDEFARQFVGDVTEFYKSVPRELWLRDRNGRLPIVVYGYAFDTRVTDPARWNKFYRAIVGGIEQALGGPIVLHWTNNGTPQQMYAFQHIPQIQSYVFNEAMPQSQASARSVTFVVHYDDLGPSSFRKGSRPARWIRNDIRYLQEALWLAKHTNPDLVFNYGWNELFEGEHLLPDDHWGWWRYELAKAMVADIKAHAKADLPRVLVIVDDFLPSLATVDGDTAVLLRREMDLLAHLRPIVPQAEVVLPGAVRDFSPYAAVFALNLVKQEKEEAALAACGRPVVYANPLLSSQTAVTRRFTEKPRRPLASAERGPANEYVVATGKVDVDLARFPLVQYRCRNSENSLFHIRYFGLNAKGQEVQGWYEGSPTEARQSHGKWLEGQASAADIARQAAGEPIARLTRMEVILDDLEDNGTFTLDVDYLRFADPQGKIGYTVRMDDWTAGASFQNVPGGAGRFRYAPVVDAGKRFHRLTLTAVVGERVTPPVDMATRRIEPAAGVTVLQRATVEGESIPILLASGTLYWLNTYTPSDACWESLIPKLLGLPLNRGVLFGSFAHTVHPDRVVSDRNQRAMVVQDEPLPIDRVRLVAPPELDKPLPHTLPVDPRRPRVEVIRGARRSIPLPPAAQRPGEITLQPGEVIDLHYGK